MGYDINIIARHRLNTENVESLAKDLSEALDINIKYGYHHEYAANIKKRVIKDAYNYHWISLGKIIRDSDKDTYRLEDKRYEQKNIYTLLGRSFEGVQFKELYKRNRAESKMALREMMERQAQLEKEINDLYPIPQRIKIDSRIDE